MSDPVSVESLVKEKLLNPVIHLKSSWEDIWTQLSVYRLLDSLLVECWLRVRDVPGSIPSQGPRHTKDVIKMVPVVPLFSTQHSQGKKLALSQEFR